MDASAISIDNVESIKDNTLQSSASMDIAVEVKVSTGPTLEETKIPKPVVHTCKSNDTFDAIPHDVHSLELVDIDLDYITIFKFAPFTSLQKLVLHNCDLPAGPSFNGITELEIKMNHRSICRRLINFGGMIFENLETVVFDFPKDNCTDRYVYIANQIVKFLGNHTTLKTFKYAPNNLSAPIFQQLAVACKQLEHLELTSTFHAPYSLDKDDVKAINTLPLKTLKIKGCDEGEFEGFKVHKTLEHLYIDTRKPFSYSMTGESLSLTKLHLRRVTNPVFTVKSLSEQFPNLEELTIADHRCVTKEKTTGCAVFFKLKRLVLHRFYCNLSKTQIKAPNLQYMEVKSLPVHTDDIQYIAENFKTLTVFNNFEIIWEGDLDGPDDHEFHCIKPLIEGLPLLRELNCVRCEPYTEQQFREYILDFYEGKPFDFTQECRYPYPEGSIRININLWSDDDDINYGHQFPDEQPFYELSNTVFVGVPVEQKTL